MQEELKKDQNKVNVKVTEESDNNTKVVMNTSKGEAQPPKDTGDLMLKTSEV